MARVKEYVGCGAAIEPDELEQFEATVGSVFCAEEKRDGCWCLLETDARGVIVRLSARNGNEFMDSHVDGLLGFETHMASRKLAGELETASQSATKHYMQRGYRRFHAFDAVDLPPLPLEQRRESLEALCAEGSEMCRQRILPVEHRRSGFRAFYDEVLARSGEGLVVKRLNSPYVGEKGQSGKRRDWFKVKPLNTVDYVCIGIGMTALGNTFMRLGFVEVGKQVEISQVQVPKQYRGDEEGLVGRVIEIKGAEIFDSGVVRHGRFSRLRTDKPHEDCTLRSALAQRAQGGDF